MEHVTRVREFRRGSPTGPVAYEGMCTCGWRSGVPVETREEAEQAATAHRGQFSTRGTD